MLAVLQVTAVFMAAVAMALALAHALELPGKLRLDQETYRAVRTIYYPGFTIGGASEVLAILATLALLLVSAREGGVPLGFRPGFWPALPRCSPCMRSIGSSCATAGSIPTSRARSWARSR